MSLKCLYIKFCNFISSTVCEYLSSPIVLVRLVPTCLLQYPCEWDPLCQWVCYVIIRVMRPGHCDNNNFPAPVLCYHPITHSGMGWTLRKWGQSGENQWSANKKGELGCVDQSESWVHQGKLWVDIRQHPQLPTLGQHQHCLDSGKTLQLPRSLGHLASIKLGGAHKSGRWMDNETWQQWWSLHQFISNTESN